MHPEVLVLELTTVFNKCGNYCVNVEFVDCKAIADKSIKQILPIRCDFAMAVMLISST